jgi:hypothetical protein
MQMIIRYGMLAAVFIRDDHDSFKHFRDAYLGYIGGQPNNYCKKHDMLLIAVVNRKGRWTECMCMDGEASQWQCGKTGFLCCAKPGCPVIVCKRHAVLIRGTRIKFECYMGSHGDLEESEGSESNNESDLEEMNAVLGTVQLADGLDGLDVVSQELPHDQDDSSEDGSMLEGNGESIFVSTSVDQDLQCMEAYVVDDEIDPDDENVVDPDDENVVDPPSELPSFLYECSPSACTYLLCKDVYIWLYCAE